LRKKHFFPFVFSHRFSFIAFLAVSLHEEPKNTIKMFSKIRPGNLKKSQKRLVGRYVAFFFSPFGAPCQLSRGGRQKQTSQCTYVPNLARIELSYTYDDVIFLSRF
jgi:hypothetical protein